MKQIPALSKTSRYYCTYSMRLVTLKEKLLESLCETTQADSEKLIIEADST